MATIRAKFEVTTDIAKVCEVDSSRFATSALHVVPGPDATVYVSATDCKILAVNCVDGEADGERLVPAGLVAKCAGKDSKRVELGDRLEVSTGRGAKTKTVVGDGEIEARFPSLPDVFPDATDATGWRVLTLDAKLLAKLAAAVSTNGQVSILLAPPATDANPKKTDVSAITSALPVLGDVGFGLAMPCATDGPRVRRVDGVDTIDATEAEIKVTRYRELVGTFSDAFRAARAAKAAAEKAATEEARAARAARL